MSYNLSEPFSFINIKLTDVGRRQLSLGQLRFTSYVLSDREVNYSIDRTGSYDILNNRILSPVDRQPNLLVNLDGTSPFALDAKFVSSAKQFATASTPSVGFFSADTSATYLDDSKTYGIDVLYYSANTNGGNIVNFSGLTSPNIGDFVRIPWSSPYFEQDLTNIAPILELSATPLNYLFYRIVSGTSNPNEYVLDRDIPDFNGAFTSSSGKSTYVAFYPSQSIESSYGSGTTVDPQVWNMNIVRTYSLPGTTTGISGYTSYGSIEYNGTKQYFGFTADTPAIGIIHYTNNFTGNTYAEQLVEKSVEINIPYLMWWNTDGNNGEVLNQGLKLYDIDGSTVSDDASGTTFRYLKDGVSSNSKIVGRVYHRLKTFVITDQEILTALSYKSNRNWTLPPINVQFTSNPKFPLTNSDATGLVNSGYSYFVSYLAESDIYDPNISYGFGNGLHCGYVTKINGELDTDGNPQFLSVSFPANSFPFLRSSANMSGATYSGTGWNANKIQLLVSEQFQDLNYQIGDVPSNSWKRISDVVGNGIYTGDTNDLTIDPLKLAGYNFIISREDYNSGTTYTLSNIFTGNTDFYNASGLTFGNETFFYGNIKCNILSTTYKTLISVPAPNSNFNDSLNDSFDSLLDAATYITEIGVLDDQDNLVAVGKPTYPIRKDDGRYLIFQLELDF
jgi:hypothetical protein